MPHINSNQNMKPHHLYEIIDKEGEDVFKYGISFEPIGKDGTSGRMRKQVSFLNRIYEWTRFFGRIIIFDIPGRKEARKIETKHIKDYEEKNGRKPKGNVRY
jgi:URI fold toxin 2